MRTGPTGLVRIAVELLEGRCTPAITVFEFDSWNPMTEGTLPWAVNKANTTAGHDIIDFAIGIGQAKTITAETTLTISDPVTIQGPNLVGSSITLTTTKPFVFAAVGAIPANPNDPPPADGYTQHQILGVRFEGCAGPTGGAVEINSANAVAVRNCAFIENKAFLAAANTHGGAVFVRGGGKMVVGGTATQQPVDNGTFVAAQTVFLRNEASDGSGGAILNSGLVVLETAWFQGNKADQSGGAIEVFGSQSEIQMPAGESSATFKLNKALNGNGGGIHFDTSSTGNSTLSGVSFVQNDAAANMSALPAPGVAPTGWGGGVYAGGGTVTITNGSFIYNTAGSYDADLDLLVGGAAALCVVDSHVTLVGIAFESNYETYTGEDVIGVLVAPTGWLTISKDCTFNNTPFFSAGKVD